MRSLEINKREIFHACKISETENSLGEIVPTYSTPVSIKITVQYLNTDIQVAIYGQGSNCSMKIISTNDCGFTRDSVFWIDVPPSELHDYVMAKEPKKTVNGFVYWLKQVGV